MPWIFAGLALDGDDGHAGGKLPSALRNFQGA